MLRVVDKGASRRLNCELLVPGVSESASAIGTPESRAPALSRTADDCVGHGLRRWFRRSRNNLKQHWQSEFGTLSKIDLRPLNYAIMASIIMAIMFLELRCGALEVKCENGRRRSWMER